MAQEEVAGTLLLNGKMESGLRLISCITAIFVTADVNQSIILQDKGQEGSCMCVF